MNSWKRNGLVLTLVLTMGLGLCACGQKGSNTTSDSTEKAVSENQGAEISSEEDYGEDDYEIYNDTEIPIYYATDFKEQVILDDDLYKVTLSKGDLNSDNYNLKWNFENKTDRTLTFYWHNIAVDGVMNGEEGLEDVPAGSKSVNDLYLDYLEEYETSEISDIQIDLVIYYADEDINNSLYAERIHVYPSGEETPVTFYTRESQDTDQVILDDDVCTITYTGLKKDNIGIDYMQFYIVNKIEHNITCYSEGLTANDYVIDLGDFYESLVDGKSSFGQAYLYDEYLEDVGLTIDEVNKVVIPIKVMELNENTGNYDQVDSKTVTIEL